jgi:Prolyl oligopeptidase family
VVNRRIFMRSAISVATTAAGSVPRIRALGRGRDGRPFGWGDAANRSEVEHAVAAVGGSPIALQVTRPLSAGGKFLAAAWGSNLDSRADLWLLNGTLTDARRLAVLPGGAWAPSFSPDRRRLAALTLVKPGRVGLAVWDLQRNTHRVFSRSNVEVFLARFRDSGSAYAAPTGALEVPRQYLWLDDASILFVDHGPGLQMSRLSVSSLPVAARELRGVTQQGGRAVRVWDDESATCGAGARLRRLSCESGEITELYDGDVRGVSLSPDRRWLALVVGTKNIAPIPDQPMTWQLSATTPFDDSMVHLRVAVLNLSNPGSAKDIPAVSEVGNVPPSRLPLWSVDSTRFAMPVRMTDSDRPSTGSDAVWEVTAGAWSARKWAASSALDAELVAALLTTEGLNTSGLIRGRPQSKRPRDYTGAGQILGGAWRCGQGRVMFWESPSLTLISTAETTPVAGEFVSVQPSIVAGGSSKTIAVRSDGKTVVITERSGKICRIDDLAVEPQWKLLAVNAAAVSLIYKDDNASGTDLMLAAPRAPTRRSSLTFNSYFGSVLRPKRRFLAHSFPDGSVRHGVLQLPVGHRYGARHPVIIWAYPNWKPSLNDSLTLGNSLANVIYPVQYLLTKGFAFFHAPFPIQGDLSDHPMKAAVSAVRPWLDVLDRQPEILAGEYGFFGHSDAGYVGLALEASTRKFKAIVAWDTFPEIGFDNLHSSADDVALNCAANVIQRSRKYYEDPTQPYTPQPSPPWKNPGRYIRNEPLFNLSGASTPLLLVEGDFDVDPREMEEVFSILYGQGVPVELAYYWGEGHVFRSPGNILDSWLRTEKFFKRYLTMQ